MSFLLTSNIFYTPFSSVSIVNFDHVIFGWGKYGKLTVSGIRTCKRKYIC